MSENDIREQLREKYYREGNKRYAKYQQDRLNKIFSDPGEINDLYLYFHDYKLETLKKIRNNIDSGDREAMLALLVITADALHASEVLPKDARKALAQSLQDMRIILEESSGFLKRGRGKRSKSAERKQSNKEYGTAYGVEYLRTHDDISLEEAIAKVSEEKGISEYLVQKRWKNKHKNAKRTLQMMNFLKQHIRQTKSANKTTKATALQMRPRRSVDSVSTVIF